MSSPSSLSEHFYTLSPSVQDRYLEKISLINNIDPYLVDTKSANSDLKNLPQISYIDIYNYIILKKSAYTQAEFRAYKSLEAYKFFKCGWVKEIRTITFNTNVLVMGKVLHSQRLNESPLQAWFIAKQDGEILCAHCTCVAGLGETCSHVSALMFLIDDTVRNEEPVTVTGEKSLWLVPSSSKKIIKRMAPVKEIDFSTSKSKHEIVHDIESIPIAKESKIYNELSDQEMENFLQTLHSNEIQASILNVTKPFCFDDVIESEHDGEHEFNFFKEDYLKESIENLLQIASSLNISLRKEECVEIERKTRGQANNKYWFKYRKGRITASLFKNVCRTNINKPSLSLLKRICYPEESNFTSAATKYGCEHEKEAISTYQRVTNIKHKNVVLSDVGLLLNQKYPMFGASPDSLVTCDCCGEGVLEVKCPHCARHTSVEETMAIKKLCITKNKATDKISLDPNHAYYFQIQMQLAISEKNYCDFIVWSAKDIYIERIFLNEQFWSKESEKAKLFFNNVVLPELLGKYFTRT